MDLEQRIMDLERRMTKLETQQPTDTLQNEIAQKNVENLIVKNIDKIGIQDLIIMILRIDGTQTREQIRRKLDYWGKAYGSWFRGGNFNTRLVVKGIVRIDGNNRDGDEAFSLTKKGEHIVDEKISKLDPNLTIK